MFLAVEIATLTREDGTTKIKVLDANEVEELIKEEEEERKAEEAKKAKTATPKK